MLKRFHLLKEDFFFLEYPLLSETCDKYFLIQNLRLGYKKKDKGKFLLV